MTTTRLTVMQRRVLTAADAHPTGNVVGLPPKTRELFLKRRWIGRAGATRDGAVLYRITQLGRDRLGIYHIAQFGRDQLDARDKEAARLSEATGEACACGHAREEHGNNPEYPGSTKCGECGDDCIAYERNGDDR